MLRLFPLFENCKNQPVERLAAWGLLLCLVWLENAGPCPPSYALVNIDAESIDLAVKYGLQRQKMGYMEPLGPNWKEGPEGTLLNIYTPFMLLAAKAARSGGSSDATPEDVKKAKQFCKRLILDFKDEKIPMSVKFSVALYGEDELFAGQTKAWIEGFARGKAVRLLPSRAITQKKARQTPGVTVKPFEAMNAYYFDFKSLAPMEEFQLILQRPESSPVVFQIRNDAIY